MHRPLTLLALLALAPRAAAQTVGADEPKEGFVALFDGKTFAGWRFGKESALGKPPANWKVEGGAIQVTGGSRPHLASQWDYEDFDLRLQWRSVKDNYNSGLFIRSGRMVGANQINLAKSAPGGFIGGKLKGAKPVPDLQKPPKEWNDWRVLAVGEDVTFWCNGKLAWKGTEFKVKRGYLGLQAEGHPMEFRNLRIKEVGYERLDNMKQWTSDGKWKADGDGFASTGKGTLTTGEASFKDYVLRLEFQGAGGEVALRGPKGKAVVSLGGSGKVNPAGEWNYLEVRVAGSKSTTWLNGEVGKGPDLAGEVSAGAIQLRAGGVMRFRNVRIRAGK